ncbi:MAG: hypothetical protein DRJ96_05720 [Thermoprotei archaeon]|nr:MAG: hypothetical protein DRJ96_05720 [Thermoprotei archaeon]
MVVRLGLVGCGGIAQLVHIPSLKRLEGVELVAVCDKYLEVARRVAAKYGVPRYYGDYEEMFRRERLDGIVNATWHAAHCEVTVAAAEAGLHVFVEKPMAVTVEECREMLDACRRHGVKLMVGFMKRFDPSLRWIRDEVRRGSLGRVFSINSWYRDCRVHEGYVRAFIDAFIRPPEYPARAYAPTGDRHLDMLLAHGVHHADLLRWMGGEVSSVVSRYYETPGGDYVSTSILKFRSGALGFFQLCGSIAGDWDEGLAIFGDEGTARAEILFPYFKWRSRAVIFRGGEYVSRLFPFRDMYLEELRYFVKCIEEDLEPSPSGYDGLRAQEIIYAIYRSAREGEEIHLS